MYRVMRGPSGELSYVKILDDGGIAFTESPGNRDWEEFQEWINQGNVPEEAEQSTPILPE